MATFFTEHEFYEDIVISPMVTERYLRWTLYLPKHLKREKKKIQQYINISRVEVSFCYHTVL